jgi:hypothetical protein
MLRTPPVAVMNYYTNLFLSARFVFGEQKSKIQYLDKEVRRVECRVGVVWTTESDAIQKELLSIANLKRQLESEQREIELTFDRIAENDKEHQKRIQGIYRSLAEQVDELDRKEYILLFKLTPLMGLKELETYMDNNMDLKSYFKETGGKVTQMELSAELEKIKIWVYQEAVQMMPYIRFTKLE